MIFLIGSRRAAKVDGARAAIEAIAAVDARFRDASIEPRDVGDVAPVLPTSVEATVAGAQARAHALLERFAHGRAVVAIGLEGGMTPLPVGGKYGLITWAAVSDGERWSYGGGGTIALPDAIARAVLTGRELGDVMDELAGASVRGTRGAWGMLTRDLVGRRDAYKLAVLAALAPFYNPALY
jgi:inosine/xanthosine triphosphatase